MEEVATTDGPYSPSTAGVKYGPWEIRPAADLSDLVEQSEQRRRKRTAD